MFLHRQIESSLLAQVEWYPVLYLGGPRQSGKTTLLQNLFPNLPYASLEDPDIRLLVTEDPRRFLNAFPKGAILDEAQRVPELFSYLQSLVDANKSLRFVLSGAQNFLLMEKITQSLAGRVGILNLLPFSYLELKSAQKPESLPQAAWKGGYPALYTSTLPPEIFFNNYIQTYLERDVRLLKNVGDLTLFSRFLRLCAGRVGQPINMSNFATDVGVAVNTIKAWLSVLEASYMIFMLPPYHQNFNKRLIKTPKMYFFDTGLVSHLLGIASPEQLDTHHYFGNIVENYLIAEFYKKRTNAGKKPVFWFWQDQKGNEVDLIIEEEGQIKAIEIKASQTYNTRLMSGLTYWQNFEVTEPRAQYLVYGGKQKMDLDAGKLMPWQTALKEL